MDGSGPQQQTLDNEPDVAMEAPPMVRFDERRMHVRAYNYWASLLGDRSFPSIEDLNPGDIEDFGSHSVLIDFTGGIDDPSIAFLGSALLRECGLDGSITRISEVPSRTLLSRLTDHYLQIVANQAPIGFEAEFTNQRNAEILYRGIMMPFSSDDDTIDFVYGVINWKEVAAPALTEDIERAMRDLEMELSRNSLSVPVGPAPVWADGPSSADFAAPVDAIETPEAVAIETSDAQVADTLETPTTAIESDEDYLSDTLCQSLADAQGAAADAISSEGRTRQALYRAIGLAHSFALLARVEPQDYAALLADAEIKAQPRSPMTALVKLVFGTHYDKTRLSEFASAIEYALAEALEPGALAERLTRYDGGLKNYVRDARAAKRGPAPTKPDKTAVARARLGTAAAISLDSIATDGDGLAVVVVRRLADGGFESLGGVAADDKRAGQILQAVATQG
ncbi:hypothetical protein LWE61_02845 [Sphingobium sufflavum]|uniref:PAS domain-containing protein n=1 Tax=Sphingobium sufflavum TaxID=1129547 RepID=UPI001F28AC60|nr:hypothetical protein [Sphingobium sufflavum]MCE7795490.1 hypothetical protein [Sphingobium sufflavum]